VEGRLVHRQAPAQDVSLRVHRGEDYVCHVESVLALGAEENAVSSSSRSIGVGDVYLQEHALCWNDPQGYQFVCEQVGQVLYIWYVCRLCHYENLKGDHRLAADEELDTLFK
jgi:hypothetical protein